jgi:acetylornithine deacetylase
MTAATEVTSTLQQLIRIPSVNPMGRPVAGEIYYEARLTDFLQGFFERLGTPWHRQPVAPQRDNIVARLDGNRPDRAVVFEVHQDTVPADGMTVDPWEPKIRDGRLYGRGACDNKGPMACMLTAFARLAERRPAEMPTVIMACTVNEENGFTGAERLARLWSAGDDPLLERLPDAMVVAEPTSFNVVVTHKGVVRWRCHTTGRAVHSSCPEQGENAIYHMQHVIAACERYDGHLASASADELLGRPTINLGTIEGGICVNAVPDRCTIELDRRLLPDEAPQEARQAAIDWFGDHLPSHLQGRVKHDPSFLACHGLENQIGGVWAEHVKAAARSADVESQQVGVAYATDAPFFARLGIPTVVFGPGSIEQAHTADEWISVSALYTGVEAYYRLAANGIG